MVSQRCSLFILNIDTQTHTPTLRLILSLLVLAEVRPQAIYLTFFEKMYFKKICKIAAILVRLQCIELNSAELPGIWSVMCWIV